MPSLLGYITYVNVRGAAHRLPFVFVETTTEGMPPQIRFGPGAGTAPQRVMSMTVKLKEAGENAAGTNEAIVGAGDDYIRIGDMAKKYDVTLRTLRFYEDKGLINPKREGSTRLYSRKDESKLKLIMLGRKVGFSLRDVKQMLDLYDPNGPNIKQLRLTLDKSEKQLARLEKQKAALDEAMKDLTSGMAKVRLALAERTMTPAGSAN